MPTITIEGNANGAPHLRPTDYTNKLSGKYEQGGTHDLSQEHPKAFAQAAVAIAEA